MGEVVFHHFFPVSFHIFPHTSCFSTLKTLRDFLNFFAHAFPTLLSILRFVERHSRLLNAYIRRAPSLLEGSLAPLMRVHRLIDFDNKRLWFRSKVRQHNHSRPYGSLRINVRCGKAVHDPIPTAHVLHDSKFPNQVMLDGSYDWLYCPRFMLC